MKKSKTTTTANVNNVKSSCRLGNVTENKTIVRKKEVDDLVMVDDSKINLRPDGPHVSTV